MFSQIRRSLSQPNHYQWFLFLLFAFLLLLKATLFNYMAFNYILLSSIFKSPFEFFGFWLPKIAVSIFFASFIFFSRRPWWTIILSLFFDLWIIANLMYFRSNDTFIDVFAISMVGNMDGFWGSILFYFQFSDLIFLLLTALYAVAAILSPRLPVRRTVALGHILGSYLLTLIGLNCYLYRWHQPEEKQLLFNPLSQSTRTTISSLSYIEHVKDFSVFHSLGFILSDAIELALTRDAYIDTDALRQSLADVVGEKKEVSFDQTLVIVLVESLESWAVNETSMPHLTAFMDSHPCLYVPKVTKQTRFGTSADGQMILNTGLLPINQGATCFRYPLNTYPSIGECCAGRSATILPHNIGVWNQQYMSVTYQYDTTLVRGFSDTVLFQTTLDCLHQGYQMVQTLTIASHSPFTYGASRSSLALPDNMPTHMANYMKSLHYTDQGLQILLSQIDSDSLLRNATVVITGDHTIFPPDMREQYDIYCKEQNIDYGIENGFVPLIIFSPNLTEPVMIADTCYQMDIYPTLMSLLGCKDYFWKGLGHDLLDSMPRRFSSDDAFMLSDLIIRSNYFAGLSAIQPLHSDRHYIAHAGAVIDGFGYTNSLEAVENSLKHGIDFIELDFDLTTDDCLVATHGFFGTPFDSLPPTHEQFMASRIFDRFTPIDFSRLDSLMKANTNLNLVTDKISDPQLINSYFAEYKNRVWVECFSDSDYWELEDLGFHVFRSAFPPTVKAKYLNLITHLSNRYFKIDHYAFAGMGADLSGRDGCLAVFGGAQITTHQADSLFNLYDNVKFVYVDYLTCP